MTEWSPVEWGRLLGRLDNIENTLTELKDRVVWRLDDLEARVEKLEHVAVNADEWSAQRRDSAERINSLEKIEAAQRLPRKIANWSIFALVGMNALGWVFVITRMGVG